MMRNFFLSMLLLAGTAQSQAQQKEGTWSLVPKVGVSIAKLSGDGFITGLGTDGTQEIKAQYRAGFMGGVEVDYQLRPSLSCSAGVFFQQQGERFKDCLMESSDGGEELTAHRMVLDYVNVPVMLHGYVAHGLSVEAGLQVGFLVHTNRSYEFTAFTRDTDGNRVYSEPHKESFSVDGVCQKVCFAVPVGVSYEYENVVLDARYALSLSKACKSWYGDSRHSAFAFTVGYRFAL